MHLHTQGNTALTFGTVASFPHDTSLYELTKNASISFVGGEKNTTVVTVDPDRYIKNGEAVIWSAEEEEEERERRAREGGRGGNGAFKAWTDGVVEGIGVASQGCVCLACDSEIEYDRSVFLFKGE